MQIYRLSNNKINMNPRKIILLIIIALLTSCSVKKNILAEIKLKKNSKFTVFQVIDKEKYRNLSNANIENGIIYYFNDGSVEVTFENNKHTVDTKGKEVIVVITHPPYNSKTKTVVGPNEVKVLGPYID